MTIRQKYALGALAALVVAAVGLFVYFQRGSDAYLNALPKDATALVRLNLVEVVKKADISLEDIAGNGQQGTVNPGLNLFKPLYGFVSGSGYIGAVAPVADEADLAAFCGQLAERGMAGEVTQQRGLSWVVIRQQWLLAFDHAKALVMGPSVGTDQENLRNQMAALMTQDAYESLTQMPLFASVKHQDEPLVANLTAAVMPPFLQGQLQSLLRVSSLDDVQLCISADLEPDELDVEARIVTQNEAVRERLEEVGKLLRPMRGDLIDRAMPDALGWAGCNVDGQALLDILRKDNRLRTLLVALNMAVDADMMMKSVDGDAALELKDASFLLGLSRELPVRMLAQLKNSDFLEQAPYWLESSKGMGAYQLSASSPTDFLIQGRGRRCWFGVDTDADLLYLAGAASLVGADGARNSYLAAHRDDIKGERLFATFDVQAITRFSLLGNDGLIGLLSLLQRLNIKMEEPEAIDIELKAAEGSNIVKDLLRGL